MKSTTKPRTTTSRRSKATLAATDYDDLDDEQDTYPADLAELLVGMDLAAAGVRLIGIHDAAAVELFELADELIAGHQARRAALSRRSARAARAARRKRGARG